MKDNEDLKRKIADLEKLYKEKLNDNDSLNKDKIRSNAEIEKMKKKIAELEFSSDHMR